MAVQTISKDELKGRLEEVLIIDVREPDEMGAVDGARKMPLGRLIRDHQSLPRDKEIVIFCRSGVRGQIACEFLAARGFNVRNLEGGFTAWSS